MSSKRFLPPFHTLVAGNMAGNLTSSVTNISNLDNIGIHCNFTTGGSPVGTLTVQVSADYAVDPITNTVLNAGTWANLITSAVPASGSPIYFDLTELSAPFIRLTYTATSGTGTLDAYITGKTVS